MEVGLVRPVDIDQEMQQAYLDYAMSVIVSRALPDARDGLKPVHRRILYAMFDMGMRPETEFKKSARIVGEVLGKYHPHGDMAVYEAMARMAQDFSMRVMLVDGQGNFGSVDGDPPAAMRYTEARLAAPAMEMLADIRKETVNFSDNFDGSLAEPDVLPAAIPNLLVNGATGIAVGMSTNVPPHNLGEVVGALVYMLENWERLDDINVENLMRFIQGPDFPTGGLIVQEEGEDELKAAYGTGRGKIVVQASAHIEEISRGRTRIIVTELPYMTNKSSLIERIAELAREERIEGIADLRDESDRHGLRIVIELSKTAEPERVLQDLYKNTPMRSTFGIIMLALVNGEPRLLSLKQALHVYLDHRLEVVQRRAEFELKKARQRAHILEGLRTAIKYLDEVIDLIRKAPDAEVARERLMKRFKLSDVQAQAILDMQLRRLAALERKKIDDEYKELQAQIKELEALLHSPAKMRQVVADELRLVKETYGDRRRTQIARRGAGANAATPILTASDLMPERTVWVVSTADGLVSRTQDEKPPRLSGTAAPSFLLQANTRDTLFLVAENGEAAGIPMHSLPESESPQDGTPLHKVSALSEGDKLAALFTLPQRDDRAEGWFVFTATRQGQVKKTPLEEMPGATGRPFTLAKVNDGDRLGWVRLTSGKDEVLLVTADGMAIRFSEEDVRPMGLVAAGVGGIKLGARDEIVGMELIPKRGEVLLVASDGKAKRVPAEQFPQQGRYGQGVIAWKLPRTTQVVGMAAGKGNARVTLLLDKLAPKAMRLDEAPLQTRAASGKPVIELKTAFQVLGLSIPAEAQRPLNEAARKAAAAVPKPVFEEDEKPLKAPEPVQQLSLGLNGAAAGAAEEEPPAKDTTKRAAAAKATKETSKMTVKSTAAVKNTAAAKPAAKKAATTTAKKPAVKSAAAAKPAAKKPTAAAKKPAVKAAKEAPKAAVKNTATVKSTAAAKPAAKKPTTAAKKPAAKKPVAKNTPAVAKKSAGKTTATAKKPTAKKPAAKSTPAAKKPTAAVKKTKP
ncbi:MAG TPA: DNA gyrase subunit A [Anaerolineales bacterium]|nr:DNA gyrase subunit A [Anaerolineales bacterium]